MVDIRDHAFPSDARYRERAAAYGPASVRLAAILAEQVRVLFGRVRTSKLLP